MRWALLGNRPQSPGQRAHRRQDKCLSCPEWGGGRKSTAHSQLQSLLIFFPSTLSVAFSFGPACSTGKTISPAWGLGAGWATFWSVFIQISFLSSPGGWGREAHCGRQG